jgi:hypothetical protein
MKVGEVYVYTDEKGLRMKRRIDRMSAHSWTSTIILCEYARGHEDVQETLNIVLSLSNDPLWKRDEVTEVELLLKDYGTAL